MDGEIASLNARLEKVKAELRLARERLGPSGWKMLERQRLAEEVVKAANSVVSEVDVAELLSCYNMGVVLLERLADYRAAVEQVNIAREINNG